MLLTCVMAPALKYHFETMNNLKDININFGETIYIKVFTALSGNPLTSIKKDKNGYKKKLLVFSFHSHFFFM